MSVLNQSGEEQVECPLCMEPLEVDDLNFYPCTCGYQICRFCWNRIREGENGLCPACRKAYPEDPADFTPLSQEQVVAMKTEKKAREAKRRNKTLESRRALANVRVVQNNLVFVVGLPVRLADPEILKRPEYFGKYGKIHKVVINQSPSYAGSQGPSASAYVTYVSASDALRAIQGVNCATLDGRPLKGSLGTTKYCANFMKNQPCPKPDCMYLHELGDPGASFTKEDMHAGLHQAYERRLHQQLLQQDKMQAAAANGEKTSSKDGSQSNFIPTTVVTSSSINVVNSSRSKKDSGSGGGGGGSSSASSSSGGGGGGKDNWPTLSCSPPNEDNIHMTRTVKSQENGTSESSSPTQSQQQQQSAQNNKNSKESHTEKSNKNKHTTNQKKKQTADTKTKDSISQDISENVDSSQPPHNNLFENEQENFLTNDIDDLESDRHSLLENHDLLDSSDHSLLDDDSAHSLLNDVNKEVLMLQRQNELLAGMVENQTHPIKNSLVNGYGLLDRDSMYMNERGTGSQLGRGLVDKELMMRRNEILMRNEMLARQHGVMMEPKHYMPGTSIGMESTNELLGANYHPNHMLPSFGMRVENSMAANGLGNPMSNPLANNMVNNINAMPNNMSNMPNNMANSMPNNMANSMTNIGNSMPNMSNPMANNMGNSMANAMGSSMANMGNMGNSLGNPMANGLNGMNMANPMSQYMMHNQQQQMLHNQQMQHTGMMNGFDAPQNTSETRYLAENMDKFFTDFRQAQQMRLLLGRGLARRDMLPENMLSAERLESTHKQRLGAGGARAGGDGDDDLDFDPFNETQKALAELMETEMMHQPPKPRLPPPGFAPQQHNMRQQGGFNRNSAVISDWTQMDPAIMSTCVPKPPQHNVQHNAQHNVQHNAHHNVQHNMQHNMQHGLQHVPHSAHDLFARFNQLHMNPINGTKIGVGESAVAGVGAGAGPGAGGRWAGVPLPPGFAPPNAAHECIDAK